MTSRRRKGLRRECHSHDVCRKSMSTIYPLVVYHRPLSVYELAGRCSLRRMGSKTGFRGSLLRPTVSPSKVPSEFGIFSRSISQAIFCKKAVVFTEHKRDHKRCSGSGVLTALANHLPPPSSNQLRWPPNEVVQSTPYGVCLTSFLGRASFTAI
jgi:hypothetical protein